MQLNLTGMLDVTTTTLI